MPENNHPIPGQTLSRVYTSEQAYRKDAGRLATQGWVTQSTTTRGVGGQYTIPELVVTYTYHPTPAPMTAPTPQTAPAWLAPTQAEAAPLYHYPLWEAGVVAGLMGLGLVFTSNDFGPVMLIAGIVWAALRDGRGLLSVRNLFQWSMMSGGAKTWAIIALVLIFPIFLIIYAAMIVFDAIQAWRTARLIAPQLMRRHTAQLESELGIMPGVEGECRACHKPLQIGADYCAYCGEPVTPRPRVCPVCSTTTLPDARFCPNCRAELPPAS